MLKTIFRDVVRLTGRSRRWCTCWCTQQPVDSATQITYLRNGVRIATEENTSPLACVSLLVAVGPRYETVHSNGLTHFIEHMAYKGFETMSKAMLEEKVNNMGARMTVKTTREMQTFSILLPADLASTALSYLSRIILELDLDEYEIEKERHNMCLEMHDSDNNPKATLFDYLHATAFQGTPLGQPVIGPTRNVCRFDRCAMSSFLCEHYTTYRFILASSGAVYHKDIVAQAQKTFGYLTPRGSWQLDPGPCRYTGSQVTYRNDAMPYAHVAIAIEAPGYASPDYLGMLVMSCLMGSWHKSQGRPSFQSFSTAREGSIRSACESYEPFYITYKDVGLWGIYFVADKMRLDEMVSYIQHAWMEMTIMAHVKEVEKAVNIAKLQISRRYGGVINSCRDIGTQMLYNCTRRPLAMLHTQLKGVNQAKVRALGDKYIYAKSPVVVGIGPTEALPPYNRIETGMYWLRW